MGFLRLSLGLSVFWATSAFGHEFWIEPADFQVEPNTSFVADLKNGEEFKGISLGWFDRRFTRFEIADQGGVRAVDGRMGDTPALQSTSGDEGLMIVLHETTPSSLTYRDWQKFLNFVEHKDFANAVRQHEENGWSKQEFRESYTRHAKSLIAVGSGAGQDRAFGLQTEFVALTNPYSENFDGQMVVKLLYNNAAREDAQVEVFAKSTDDTVEISLYRTNKSGEVTIPVSPGFTYLFDAVVLRESVLADSDPKAPIWETLWAALTFAVPAR